MRTILLFLILIISISATAQITTPIVKANFGVDGDLRPELFNRNRYYG